MRMLLILIVIGLSCLLPFHSIYAEIERELPNGMTEEKLRKSVNRQFNYITKRLLSGKSADKILASNNTTAINILKDAKRSSEDIATLISENKYKEAYFALKDLNNSLKIALKLSRAKDVAHKKSQDEAENARIISDAYLDRAKQHGIDAGDGGKKAYKHFTNAINLRNKASILEEKSSFAEAVSLYSQATDELKKAIAVTKDRESFELEFTLNELQKENDRRLEEARQMGIDKGKGGRRALVAYEHGMERRAQGNDLLEAHNYGAAISMIKESNDLFIDAAKHGKYYLSKSDESGYSNNNNNGVQPSSLGYE
ncbi:MAG: hypothetical protein JRF02_08185 [Deltaproteobacteria bacterium]|jgi:hypothetical protein|nr:hypothetical protein [Deltaproteobacteria bacterium]